MTTPNATCALILTSSFDVLLWAGAVVVWFAVSQMRAASVCRLGVALLVTTQVCSVVGALASGRAQALDWVWLVETVSYFTFLYLLYHMAALLSACRGRGG